MGGGRGVGGAGVIDHILRQKMRGAGGGGGGLTEEWVRRQIEPLDELQTMKAVR